jgi:F-type H+-transporting ATPase subunit b
MLRRSIPALGLLALLLAFGPPSRPAFAQEPAKDHGAPAASKGGEAAQAAEHPGEADHAVASQPNIMEPQPPLAIWTFLVFLGLLLVLGKYAWKPLIKALHEREAHLEQVLLDSERARNEAEELAARHRKELSQAADQVRALIEEARKEAQVAAASIIQKAQGEAEASRQRAEREIAGARDQALMEIWSKTADLAVSVAGKVLSKELGEADHRRLVEVATQELPANGDGREGARS